VTIQSFGIVELPQQSLSPHMYAGTNRRDLNAVCTIPRRNVLKSVGIAKHNTRI